MAHELAPLSTSLPATRAHYVIKRDFWSFFERTFRVFADDGRLVMLIRRPLFRLREEFVVHGDAARQQPLLRLRARQVVAFNFAYEISDAASGAVLGAVQKRGLASLVRDRFILFGPDGAEVGHAEELGASLLRRFIPLLPSHHGVFVDGQQVASVDQRFRLFGKEFSVDLVPGRLDPRFVLAVALLAVMAESRREDN